MLLCAEYGIPIGQELVGALTGAGRQLTDRHAEACGSLRRYNASSRSQWRSAAGLS